MQLDGRILLLGCDHDTVTFLHYAEHVVEFPGKRVVQVQGAGARSGIACVAGHGGVRHLGRRRAPALAARFFARLVDTYLARPGTRAAESATRNAFLFDARGPPRLRLRGDEGRRSRSHAQWTTSSSDRKPPGNASGSHAYVTFRGGGTPLVHVTPSSDYPVTRRLLHSGRVAFRHAVHCRGGAGCGFSRAGCRTRLVG